MAVFFGVFREDMLQKCGMYSYVFFSVYISASPRLEKDLIGFMIFYAENFT